MESNESSCSPKACDLSIRDPAGFAEVKERRIGLRPRPAYDHDGGSRPFPPGRSVPAPRYSVLYRIETAKHAEARTRVMRRAPAVVFTAGASSGQWCCCALSCPHPGLRPRRRFYEIKPNRRPRMSERFEVQRTIPADAAAIFRVVSDPGAMSRSTRPACCRARPASPPAPSATRS